MTKQQQAELTAKRQLEEDIAALVQSRLQAYEQETGKSVVELRIDFGRAFTTHEPQVEVTCFVAGVEG